MHNAFEAIVMSWLAGLTLWLTGVTWGVFRHAGQDRRELDELLRLVRRVEARLKKSIDEVADASSEDSD